MITTLLVLVLAYVAGRIHGYSLRKRFIAEGFRIMQRQAEQRGMAYYHVDDLVSSAADVSRAFGSLRDPDDRG